MGDSSGGGLALGLCESFVCEKIEQPNELVLIAPRTDLTSSNPKIEEVQKLTLEIMHPKERRLENRGQTVMF